MKTLGYYNGKFGELEDMSIPMNDRVCWFGDGVYDAGPSRNYKIFAMDEHVDRFFNSAGLLDIKMPMSKEELKALLQEMVDKMDTGNLFVYYQGDRNPQSRIYKRTGQPVDHAEAGRDIRRKRTYKIDYLRRYKIPTLQHKDLESDSFRGGDAESPGCRMPGGSILPCRRAGDRMRA